MTEEIAVIRGEDVFARVRDILTNEAARIRGFDSVAVRGGLGRDQERSAAARGIEAAADILTGIIAAGQEIRLRKSSPPSWIKSDNDRRKWIETEFSRVDELLRALAGQARAALSAREDDAESADERSLAVEGKRSTAD
jgi:hypothetical protein